jgi:hypothetical protein
MLLQMVVSKLKENTALAKQSDVRVVRAYLSAMTTAFSFNNFATFASKCLAAFFSLMSSDSIRANPKRWDRATERAVLPARRKDQR